MDDGGLNTNTKNVELKVEVERSTWNNKIEIILRKKVKKGINFSWNGSVKNVILWRGCTPESDCSSEDEEQPPRVPKIFTINVDTYKNV